MRGLVYSRYGYGFGAPRPVDGLWSSDYPTEQARDHLPVPPQTSSKNASIDVDMLLLHEIRHRVIPMQSAHSAA